MANDRMYIRCKGCGDLHYLAKCYDDGYFTTHEGEELRQGLDDFFDRHKWCYRDKYYGGFELVYESDEDAESEDERIRKWLVNYFKAAGKSWIHRDISPEQILVYLEKQKEPENTSASTMAPSCWADEHPKEQKPEWSEDDEAMRDNILRLLSCFVGTLECDSNPSLSTSYPAYQREMDWLKSLRPSWKPSEEQMAALEAATVRYQSTGLESLYEDLKKL